MSFDQDPPFPSRPAELQTLVEPTIGLDDLPSTPQVMARPPGKATNMAFFSAVLMFLYECALMHHVYARELVCLYIVDVYIATNQRHHSYHDSCGVRTPAFGAFVFCQSFPSLCLVLCVFLHLNRGHHLSALLPFH